MRISTAICHGQISHIRYGVRLGKRVQVGGQLDGVRIQHQNRGLVRIGDAVWGGRGQFDIVQAEQHGKVMLNGVAHGTIASNGHAGKTHPIPELLQIADGMGLRVDDGNDETTVVRGIQIVDARAFGQIVVQRDGQ